MLNLLRLELIDLASALQMDPMISNDNNIGLQAESQENSMDISVSQSSKPLIVDLHDDNDPQVIFGIQANARRQVRRYTQLDRTNTT